jgi:lysophospholipase L1-like esterase
VHEGHAGWRTDKIEAALKGWLESNTSDWVLIHIGTNDYKKPIEGTAEEDIDPNARDKISDIVEILRASNPNVGILLAQIIPSSANHEDIVIEINSEIEMLQIELDLPGLSTLILVEQYTGYDALT